MIIDKLYINKNGVQVIKYVDIVGRTKFYVSYTAENGLRYEITLEDMDESEVDLLEPSHIMALDEE